MAVTAWLPDASERRSRERLNKARRLAGDVPSNGRGIRRSRTETSDGRCIRKSTTLAAAANREGAHSTTRAAPASVVAFG